MAGAIILGGGLAVGPEVGPAVWVGWGLGLRKGLRWREVDTTSALARRVLCQEECCVSVWCCDPSPCMIASSGQGHNSCHGDLCAHTGQGHNACLLCSRAIISISM